MNSIGSKTPNDRLRSERELRGWSQGDLAEKVGTTQKIVSRWERGENAPLPYYQQKLIKLFGKDAAALGFRDSEKRSFSSQDKGSHDEDEYSTENTSRSSVKERGGNLAVQAVPVGLLHAHQAIGISMDTSITPEKRLGALLALEANQFATLFDEGWSIDELLKTLGAVLPGIEAMSKITRRTFGRKLLQLGALAAVSGIPDPSERHISAEERTELHTALGESIKTGWKMVQTSKPDQILALGHAQLSLVQQFSSLLYPSVRPLLIFRSLSSYWGCTPLSRPIRRGVSSTRAGLPHSFGGHRRLEYGAKQTMASRCIKSSGTI